MNEWRDVSHYQGIGTVDQSAAAVRLCTSLLSSFMPASRDSRYSLPVPLSVYLINAAFLNRPTTSVLYACELGSIAKGGFTCDVCTGRDEAGNPKADDCDAKMPECDSDKWGRGAKNPKFLLMSK